MQNVGKTKLILKARFREHLKNPKQLYFLPAFPVITRDPQLILRHD